MTNGPRGDFWHEHFSADEMCKYHWLSWIIITSIIRFFFFVFSYP
jgi:uncharacterized protein YqcC (DUF446 family)